MDLERYLERDDRIIVPVGSTEQHGYLSLATDSAIAERVAVEAAEPLDIPVLPVLPYGFTPWFARYPVSPSLTLDIYAAVLVDLVQSIQQQGFRRVMIVNGHGGNVGAASAVTVIGARWHDWDRGPRIAAVLERSGVPGGHAAWTENFPWTRLAHAPSPAELKARVIVSRDLDADAIRTALGDGSFGGRYQVEDDLMRQLWEAGVLDLRDVLTDW